MSIYSLKFLGTSSNSIYYYRPKIVKRNHKSINTKTIIMQR